jgi:hypothetical protein
MIKSSILPQTPNRESVRLRAGTRQALKIKRPGGTTRPALKQVL